MDADIIVVGSGPAGVSASYPLVQAGLKVLMLDSGRIFQPQTSHIPYIERRANDRQQHKWIIGNNFYSLQNSKAASPKMRVPNYEDVLKLNSIEDDLIAENFYVTTSKALGGLSNAWGCGVAMLSREEFSSYPFGYDEILESYEAVARRIGISGAINDDLSNYYLLDQYSQSPIALGVMQKKIYEKYSLNKLKININGTRIGRSRVAAISSPLVESRSVCNSCGNCLWGCSRHSLYSAAYDLEKLIKFPNFRILSEFKVKSVISQEKFSEVQGVGLSGEFRYKSRRIVLAAGTLSSTQIMLNSVKNKVQKVPLKTSPSAGYLLWLPKFYGRSRCSEFSLGQLSIVQSLSDGVSHGFGSLFSIDSIPVIEFMRAMPFSSRNGLSFLGPLLSSCIAGNLFFPGKYSENFMEFSADGGLKITGNYTKEFKLEADTTKKKLGIAFFKMGAILLPGSFRLGAPGADIHYASTMPMKKFPRGLQVDKFGESLVLNRIHIVDGSVLPELSEKSHTLTIMANADRIGRHLSSTFK